MSTTTEKEKFDPSRRRLCPDGACIGLLDENGRCRECGQQGGGPGGAPVIVPDPPEDEEADEPLEAAPEDGGSAGFDAGRRLCPDGACLGVIGAGGRCSVCGRTEEG
jgi:hypothetical protein